MSDVILAKAPQLRRVELSWQLARGRVAADDGAAQWIPAVVPGAVQLDWARAHNLPDFHVGDNVRQWQGLDESHWTYRAALPELPPLATGERLFLVLEGVDYECEVSLSGERLHHHRGLQTPIRLDVTDKVRAGAVASVHIFPAPKSRPTPVHRSQADDSCKPPVAYGWDFHPRLIPLGLWREAYLEARPARHFASHPEINYTLDEACTRATGRLEVALAGGGAGAAVLRWRLRAPDGGEVLTEEKKVAAGEATAAIPFAIDVPAEALWWPHDQGRPALYTSEVELVSPDGAVFERVERRVGLRRVRLVMAPGEWDTPAVFPKSRSRPPITLEINGRPIFAKGSNWVGPDVFPGRVTAERYDALLELARASHLNILRVWGGATAPHDRFYERCDELGLMVWQEFPLACNLYPDDADFLEVLDGESRSLIARLRGFASVVLWCGGNELFNAWSKMTDQSLALRLLNRNCYELDPRRPFLPTAPIDGMGHGHYVFRDATTGEEAWAMMQRSNCTAYSEFGCPGPAPVAVLRRIIAEEDLWPPRRGTAWETHHAFGSWQADSWLHLATIERYFGPSDSLEQLVERGQLLQAAGFQGMFEEARRQKPTASMALNWCLNEPWPCAANNSLVAWPCEPKPALALVAEACRPTLASARIRKFAWAAGECFDPEIWLLHDAPAREAGVEVEVWLELGAERHRLLTWSTGEIEAGTNRRGPRAQFTLPELTVERFGLRLVVPGRPEWSSHYTLLQARPAQAPGAVEHVAGALNV